MAIKYDVGPGQVQKRTRWTERDTNVPSSQLTAYVPEGTLAGRESNAMLQSLLPTSMNLRNTALGELLGQFAGPDFETYLSGALLQDLLAKKRGSMETQSGAMAKRGMRGGVANESLQNLLAGYGAEVGQAAQQGRAAGTAQMSSLLSALSEVPTMDKDVLGLLTMGQWPSSARQMSILRGQEQAANASMLGGMAGNVVKGLGMFAAA